MLRKKGKVLHQIEQAGVFAGSVQKDFERDAAWFAFGSDTFPIKKAIPIGREGANLGLGSIRGDEESIVGKKLSVAILGVFVAR